MIELYLKALNIEKIKTLKDIDVLINKHLSEFSFTSIPVLLQEEITLELSDIIEKVVLSKRGGYCFEHNKLIHETLVDAGFEVKAYLGRVLNNQDIDVPKTHRFSILTYKNEKYIVDVGFGYASPNSLVKFDGETKTPTGMTYRVKNISDDQYELQLVLEDGYFTLYSFELSNYNELDYEMGHFYSHKHPKAKFVNNLVISKVLNDEVRSLVNGNYQKIFSDKKSKTKIHSAEELEEILKDEFEYPIKNDEVKKLYDTFINN